MQLLPALLIIKAFTVIFSRVFVSFPSVEVMGPFSHEPCTVSYTESANLGFHFHCKQDVTAGWLDMQTSSELQQ